MFVKVMKWKITKNTENGNVIYEECMEQIFLEAKNAELIPMGSDDKDVHEPYMRLFIDVGEKERKEFNFPQKSNCVSTEVYYMNDQGKTIESFIY